MEFDIFFSISQTPVNGYLPSERVMFNNFFEQVEVADRLGFKTAWIAESHFSSEVQKGHKNPVIPHWQGEVGLNADIFQLSHKIFSRTKKIHTGSAVMNIVCNGGPIAAAEKAATFCTLHGLDQEESRNLHLGFSAGRFEFMNRTSGIVPRNTLEAAAWPALKGKIFYEATEIFLKLLRGDTISSLDTTPTKISKVDFRTEEEWDLVRKISETKNDFVAIPNRWEFETTKIIPQDWRRELLQPIIGTHDPKLQELANGIYPVKVFNLSITKPEIIEDTHRRMKKAYHSSGGPWKRSYMPRTVFVFINEQNGLTEAQKRSAAKEEANTALGEYWKAIEGTLDLKKIEGAADNALIGSGKDIAEQIVQRFDPEDRLMLWFDFFNHDNARVISNMEAFMKIVVPKVRELL